MAETRGNSDKELAAAQNKEPRTRTVVSDDDIVVESQAKSDFREFVELFLPEDPGVLKKSIMQRVADGLKSLASDLFNSILYPGGGWTRSTPGNTNYSKGVMVVPQQPNNVTPMSPGVSTPRNSGVEIRLRSYNAAADVWKECALVLSQYPVLRVMDLKNAAGEKTITTDNDYGWKDMNKFQMIKNFDGTWSILAPQPYEIQ